MKRQTLWWILGGSVVVGGGGTLIYLATRPKKVLPSAGDSKALAPAPKDQPQNGSTTAPVIPGTRSAPSGIQAAMSAATAAMGNSVDWAASLAAEGTPR